MDKFYRITIEMGMRLGRRSWKIFWKCIEKIKGKKYWKTLKDLLTAAKYKFRHNTELGKPILCLYI